MIYLDTSVVLAQLFAEDRVPADDLWEQMLISSRLLEYETWNRIHAKALTRSQIDAARDILGRVAFLELISPILTRALDPFPMPIRTLDGLHLASVEFLRSEAQDVQLASYDDRMIKAARHLRIPLYQL